MNPSETPNSCNRQAGLDSSNLPETPDSCGGLSCSFENLAPDTDYIASISTGRDGVRCAWIRAVITPGESNDHIRIGRPTHCDGDPGDEHGGGA